MSFISRFRDFGPVKYLMSKTVVEGATLRAQQEQLDMYRAAVLLKGHDWFTQNVSTEGNIRVYKQPEQSDVEKFYTDVDCMLPKAIQALVQRSIDTQIRDMFTKIHAAQSATPKVETSEDNSQSIQPSSALLDSLGFELECRESKIPNAGKVIVLKSASVLSLISGVSSERTITVILISLTRWPSCFFSIIDSKMNRVQGVFIKGEVAPGTVIALFPGTIHLAEFARGKDYLKSLMPDDNFNLMMRYNNNMLLFFCLQEPNHQQHINHLLRFLPSQASRIEKMRFSG